MTVTPVSNFTSIGGKESDNSHNKPFRIRAMTSLLKTPQTHYIVVFSFWHKVLTHIPYFTGSSTTGYQATAESERSNSFILNTPSNTLGYMLQVSSVSIRFKFLATVRPGFLHFMFYTQMLYTVLPEDKSKTCRASRQCGKEKHSRKKNQEANPS